MNVGPADKAIRLLLGMGLGAWVLFGIGFGSTTSYVALGVAAILIVTAFIGFCPLFRILGINTNKADR